jgi:SH3-like domain-containing protein
VLMDTRDRYVNSPIAKVVRWTVPWVLLVVVSWYLWGFYTQFKLSARTAATAYVTPEQAAMRTTATVEATLSVPAGQVGVALVDGVRLRTTPAENAQVTASVGKGTKLVLLEKRDNWYRVRDPLGHIGWVTSSDKFIQIVKQ